jgi:hypothetical protein
MRTLFKAILATVALAAPLYANAIPVTWNYSGVCTSGDCGEVPGVTGTLTGDPTLFGDSGHLTEVIIGEVLSYNFWFGSHNISGTGAIGEYTLDANRNITGGSMIFGNLSLKLADVGAWTWTFIDKDCGWFSCRIDTEAYGSGSYTRAVPEPTTLSLLGLGLLGFGLISRRRAN